MSIFRKNQSYPRNCVARICALKAKFNLSMESSEGFPTIVLLNQNGETVFEETGYDGGGTAEILAELQRHTDPPAASCGFAEVLRISTLTNSRR